MKDTNQAYAIIGGGPSGLSAARNLQKYNVPFVGFDTHSGVGGLWDIKNPKSTVYKSAHLISSKKKTEFEEFPMAPGTSDFPKHDELCKYFNDFADHFGLKRHFRFNSEVTRVEFIEDKDLWLVETRDGFQAEFKGVILANGNLSEPNKPSFKGNFTGELIHSADYKDPEIFKNKRVLIIGAGNSGCDIAVDAVHYAKSVDVSVRRGYYFFPKYAFGKPIDTLNAKLPIPHTVKRTIHENLLKVLTGDPTRFGFPKPKYKLYQSHPVINSLILHYIGHGDIKIQHNIERLEGSSVHFESGESKEYDIILMATGYVLHYPFIDKSELSWENHKPNFFLNIFSPKHPRLFICGLLEALGIGWQGRYRQADLLAKYISLQDLKDPRAELLMKKIKENDEDLTNGMNYLKLARMAYYVDKESYLNILEKYDKLLS